MGHYVLQPLIIWKLGAEKPPMPFGDSRLLGSLLHYLVVYAVCGILRNAEFVGTNVKSVLPRISKGLLSQVRYVGMGADAIIPTKSNE